MNIAVVGYTDKRPLIYALFKLLQHTGDVIFITDDRRYLRLSEGFITPGHFQNIMLCVTDESPDSVWEAIEHEPEDFAHVIYDLKAFLPDRKMDITYLCKTFAYEDGEEEYMSLFDEGKTVKFMYDGKSSKEPNSASIAISPKLVCDLEMIESLKILPPVRSPEIVNLVAGDFAEPLNMNPKTLKKVLLGGWKG